MAGCEFQDWAVIERGENGVGSSHLLEGDVGRLTDVSHESPLSQVDMGKDLEEFLRAVYEAQNRLSSS